MTEISCSFPCSGSPVPYTYISWLNILHPRENNWANTQTNLHCRNYHISLSGPLAISWRNASSPFKKFQSSSLCLHCGLHSLQSYMPYRGWSPKKCTLGPEYGSLFEWHVCVCLKRRPSYLKILFGEIKWSIFIHLKEQFKDQRYVILRNKRFTFNLKEDPFTMPGLSPIKRNPSHPLISQIVNDRGYARLSNPFFDFCLSRSSNQFIFIRVILYSYLLIQDTHNTLKVH